MMMIIFLIEEFLCRLSYPMPRLLGVGKLSLIILSLFLRGFLFFFFKEETICNSFQRAEMNWKIA